VAGHGNLAASPVSDPRRLLAGLDELVHWLLQQYNAIAPGYDLTMGDDYRDFNRDEARAIVYTVQQVRAWQPPQAARTGSESETTAMPRRTTESALSRVR
jgi:hypothetical protein